VTDLNSYLESLQMEITFAPFDVTGRARITQLVNKSNQFNLTTRRYSEPQIAALEKDAALTLQIRLKDAFGDNGMISVIICRALEQRKWEIDTWLMSCRVLGRGVEQMALREMLQHARQGGVEQLIGIYIPTQRNRLVADHYARLGFTLIEEAPDGTTKWALPASAQIDEAPMAVRHVGFDLIAV